MRINLKNIIKPTGTYLFLYILFGLLIWVATYIGAFYTKGIAFDELTAKLFDADLLWKNAASIVLTAVNAILLLQLVNRFSFVGSRTFLPVFAFALLTAVWEPTHALYQSHMALFLFICALFQFFNTSENKFIESVFLGSLFVACASLWLNDLIFVIPFCLLGFIFQHRFSLRILLASFLGVLAPWFLYGIFIYIKSPVFDFQSLFYFGFSLGFSMEELQLPTKIYIGALFAVFFTALFGTYADFYKLANSTRRNINFNLVLLIYFILVFIFQQDFEGTFFPFITLCFSVFIANVFSTKRNDFYSILFLIFLGVNIAFAVYNFLW